MSPGPGPLQQPGPAARERHPCARSPGVTAFTRSTEDRGERGALATGLASLERDTADRVLVRDHARKEPCQESTSLPGSSPAASTSTRASSNPASEQHQDATRIPDRASSSSRISVRLGSLSSRISPAKRPRFAVGGPFATPSTAPTISFSSAACPPPASSAVTTPNRCTGQSGSCSCFWKSCPS